jgi:ATP-dependent DNA helicase RecQ
MYLPCTPEELVQIKGFGAQKVAQYGEEFLAIINVYCEANQLESQIEKRPSKKTRKEKPKNPGAEKKTSTQEISLALFLEKKDISAVAKERNLQPTTIEGHLVPFVLEGMLDRNVIITSELFQKASEVVLDLQTTRLGAIKEVLGDEISFGQIKLVVQWLVNEGKIRPDSTAP